MTLPADGVRLFGTDGVRGEANVDLTPDFALELGKAAGQLVPSGSVVIGRDTRRSGEMLSMALQAGLHSVGVDTVDVGVIPSGGISWLVSETGADLGMIVSASHNPAADNGIKLLSKHGTKLSDAEEDEVEATLRGKTGRRQARGTAIGTRFPMNDAIDRYIDHLAREVPYTFRGISLVLDCAHGSAYQAAPRLYERLKASVTAISNLPDGNNINLECGATHPQLIVSKSRGTVGFAFDGDADRLIAVDEQGNLVDGDATLAILARHWKSTGKLKHDVVVATVMSNLGLHRSMQAVGIKVIETQVGDRYVAEAMRRHKAVLGGEQSGHVICADRARTGDGLLTGLRLLEVMAATGKPLFELRQEAITVFPQVLKNLRVVDKNRLPEATKVWTKVKAVERQLGVDGRVLVRASGTEPLVRVMVEAPDEETANRYTDEIIAVVGEELGKER